MAQVNLYQYAEIVQGTNPPIILGNKAKPSTITLTGTGEIYHRVYNDFSAWPLLVYDSELTDPVKFIAVKSTVDGQLVLSNSEAGGHNSSIPVEANIWTFISGGGVTQYNVNDATRAHESVVDITRIYFDAVVASADLEVLVAY